MISLKGKPITFYSRKLTQQKQRYTVTEKELHIGNLEGISHNLLGQQLNIYTDDKNLTCKNSNSDRVLRWRFILEEYGLNIEYTPGKKIIAADALS